MHKFAWLLAACAALPAPATAQFQGPGQDPNGPCAQRLVSELSPGSYWNGTVPLRTEWRDDEALFNLVTDIVDRDTPETDALSKLRAYVAAIPAEKRPTALPALFSALVDQTNDQRSLLIQRLEQLGLRQRRMGDTIANLSTRIDAMPADDAARAEVVGQRDFDVRAFSETQHTMRYACEAPVNMERRLGLFAQMLQAAK